MPKYMLFLYEDPAAFQELSPEEMQAVIRRYHDWRNGLEEAGRLVASDKLKDGEGRVVRRDDGRVRILDGPYSETKEVIGGFFAIEAESYEQAVEVCDGCPHLDYGTIEIRETEVIQV